MSSCVYAQARHGIVVPRSYDSSKEDAQNPNPDFDDTPPGKRAFQKGKAGKAPLRVDSQQTVVETPPPKAKRADTEDLSGSLSKKVRHALRRPQSVDQQSTSERKDRAKQTQKQLQREFEEADDSQDPKDPEAEANTNSPASTKASTNGKAKAKAKGAAKSAPKKKGTAEDDESEAPNKPDKDSGKKGKAEESEAPTKPKKDSGKKGKAEESEAPTKPKKDSGKNGKAEESEAPTKPEKDSGKKGKAEESEAPTKPKKDSGKKGKAEESEAPTKREKDSGKKRKAEEDESEVPTPTKPNKKSKGDGATAKQQEDHRTARSSNQPMPSPKKAARKPHSSPSKDKQANAKEATEEQSLENKKKFAHKMYMRFYRSRTCPTEIKSAFDQSKYCKNKMSSLYEDFLQTEGDWKKSMIFRTIKSITRNGRRGIRRWLTRSQMLVHFDDASIVDSIIARKETDEYLKKTEVREHPECPGLIQYLVLVDEEVTDEDVDEIADLFQQEDRGESDDGSSSDDDDDEGKSKDDKKSKKKSKKNAKKNKKGKKEKDEKDEKAEEEKARFKKAKQAANKAIGQLSKMIRDHNAKIADLDGSKQVQKAFRKDLDDCIGQLSACRASLQSAVDGQEENDMVTLTEQAEQLMKKMQGQVLAFGKKKSFVKGMGKSSSALDVPDLAGGVSSTSEVVFDMVDNVAAAGSIAREMRGAKSTDAAGLLPAPLTKLGTFSGKNHAPVYVETVLKQKHDSEEEVCVKVPVLLPHRILSFLFEELGLEISADALAKYWAHCKRWCDWCCDPDFDGSHIPVSLYGDTARYGQGYDQAKITGCFMSLVLWRPKSTRMSQWLLWCLDTELSLGWKSHNPLYRAIVESLNAAFDGLTPDNRPLGRKFAVTQMKGDWEYHYQTWMFLVENGYFGDPDNSLHKLLVVAFRDFKAFQKERRIYCSQTKFVPNFVPGPF
ncbi:unnamed protein product [Symbiodinium sp. CCMP2592]|nr:unnamed protein product [Symbiodinium sp. CCMP2592]